jgi:hypothetical protein
MPRGCKTTEQTVATSTRPITTPTLSDRLEVGCTHVSETVCEAYRPDVRCDAIMGRAHDLPLGADNDRTQAMTQLLERLPVRVGQTDNIHVPCQVRV